MEAHEAGRWGGRESVAGRLDGALPSVGDSGQRASKRDLLTILAGAAAVAGIGYAMTAPDSATDSVAPSSTRSKGGSSDLRPVDRNWDVMGASSGSASGAVSSGPVADLPLVARTEAEHIAQTQSLAGVMMPRLKDGQVTGFTIREGAMPPVLHRAGVRPGDVVVSINDRPLDSNAVVSGLSRDLAGARRATIIVERGGRRETLSTPLAG